jgi:hypothetical protein
VRIGVDEAVTVKLEVLATEKFQFNAAADLHVTAVALPGYRLIDLTHVMDAGRTFRAIPDGAVDADDMT